MNSIYSTLFSRIPANVRPGRREAIRCVIDAAMLWHQIANDTAALADYSEVGRAKKLATEAKHVASTIARGRGQLQHLQKQIAERERAIEAKAIGEARSTDAEWRSYLRTLSPGDAALKFMNDPNARGAALREPGLSGLTAEVIAQGRAAAVREAATDDADSLAADREAAQILETSLATLGREIMSAPIVVEGTTVRPMNSLREFESWVSTAGMLYPKDVILAEVEIDAESAE